MPKKSSRLKQTHAYLVKEGITSWESGCRPVLLHTPIKKVFQYAIYFVTHWLIVGQLLTSLIFITKVVSCHNGVSEWDKRV